jgi:hypothetical protein
MGSSQYGRPSFGFLSLFSKIDLFKIESKLGSFSQDASPFSKEFENVTLTPDLT